MMNQIDNVIAYSTWPEKVAETLSLVIELYVKYAALSPQKSLKLTLFLISKHKEYLCMFL